MGGEGAMMAANQSLKSNRSQLRRKERSFNKLFSNSEEKPEYDFPNATPQKLHNIKKKLVLDRKVRRTKIFLFVGICLFLISVIFFYLKGYLLY